METRSASAAPRSSIAALARAPPEATVVAGEVPGAATVSPGAAPRPDRPLPPFKDGAAFATPATNQAIAEELHLSVDAVKTHMRALFEKLEVEDLPQNRKRVGAG